MNLSSEYPLEIYAKDNLRITVDRQASGETVDLLKQVVYGTHGPRYRHTGLEVKVAHLTEPYFFSLYVDTQLAGTYCLSGRQVSTAAGTASSFYGRYFAITPAYGGKGYGSLLKSQAIHHVESTVERPHLFYSYIEESNERSMKISLKDGYTSVGVLEAVLFSRLYPSAHPMVSRLPENERANMLSLLKTGYEAYTLVQFNQVYYNGHYFVFKENGEIIAGAQANPIFWQMVGMPGLSGQLIMHLLPHVPVLRRLFNPSKYQFVALEAVYMKEGRGDALLHLLESVLAHFGFTSALWMLDVNSPMNRLMKGMGKLGLLNAMQKSIQTHVMVKSNGIDLKDVKESPWQPIYVSAFDCT